MMSTFRLDIESGVDASWDDPQGISLSVGETCFTELIRHGEDRTDRYLRAPPIQLAFWITDNWWRLRWEPVVSRQLDPAWRLAHELSAIGGGYIWPGLRIWGEDSRVGFASRSDPDSVDFALRFTTDAVEFVSADAFESSVDKFLQSAVDARSTDTEALKAQYVALKEEQADDDAATWRRLEAKLGYDVDDAPDGLVHALAGLAESYGYEGVEEAIVARQGETAASSLETEITAAEKSRVVCEMRHAVHAAGPVRQFPGWPVWQCAEEAATNVRRGLGAEAGPLRNTRLSELLGISRHHFRSHASRATGPGYGLRLRKGDGERNVVALKSPWAQGRRFEMCRALGDAIWSGNDAMGPITRTRTARQKFQRAFAQSLLCPYEDLLSYMGTRQPSEEDMSAAARHFHVSERVVQTVLVNKGDIDRQRFAEMEEAAWPGSRAALTSQAGLRVREARELTGDT